MARQIASFVCLVMAAIVVLSPVADEGIRWNSSPFAVYSLALALFVAAALFFPWDKTKPG